MILVLAFLSALLCVNSFPNPGKELIYDYRARIRVGTYEPVSFASQFVLEGKLHLQHDNQNSTLARFTDLTYKLYNGELNRRNELESKLLPLPQETVDLLRIFRIEYDEDGKLRYITTETGEQRYSRNIKKAIASLLQLDRKNLQLNLNTPHAFVTEERSIYGRGLEEYNVIPEGNEIIVQKMRDVKTSRNWYRYLAMNLEAQYNDVPANSPISISSHRQYTLIKNENEIQIKRLEAHGGIYVHLFKGLTDAQYISVNQTLEFLEVIPVENKYRINNEERTDQIEFRFDTETESGTVVDLSFGRHSKNPDQLIRLIQRALDDAVTYLEVNQLNLEAPDVLKGQAINRLHRLLSQLDIPNLEQLYTTLSERNGERDKQILNIYLQILPLVGSRATVISVRNLIRKNKVDDDLKINMLNKLPFYLRMRSEILLQELEELADLGNDFNLDVRRAGVLCFASLVHKVFAHRSHLHDHEHHHVDDHEHIFFHYPGNWDTYHVHQHEHPHDEHHHEEQLKQNNRENKAIHEQDRILDRYIVKFVNLLENSRDFQSQFLYIQALYNIQVGNVSKYLEPYVKGTVPNSNRHLQFLAMCASLAGDIKDPERVFRIYWPIFTNRKLHVELRAGAYVVIMSTKPTMAKLWNIYWVLQSEQSPELYHFVYTHLQSLASVKTPILQEFKANAAQILRYVRKPYKNYLSGNYIFDYKDPKYDFGAMVQTMFISTSTSKTLYIDLTNHLLNIPLQFYSLYLKVDGLDQSIIEKLPKEKILRFNLGELEQLVNIISSLHENKNIHVEYSVLHHNQVVRIEYYDKNNIKELVDNLQNIQIENNKLLQSSLNIQYNLLSQIVLPNDLGFPTLIQIKSPRVTNNFINITREIANKITNIRTDIRLQNSMQTSLDVSFYNPIPDVWQGIQRINSYDHVIPLNLNAAINTQQHSVKLSINRNEDNKIGGIGIRSHVRNLVYVLGDEANNYLKQSNNQCNVVEEVSRGKENKKTFSLLNFDDENTGLNYEVAVFDNERPVSHKSIVDLLRSLLQKDNKSSQEISFLNLLLSIRNLWVRIVLLPGIGTSGFLVRAVPSTENSVSQIDLFFRYNQEINREENSHLPSTRLNTRATYSVKAVGEKLLKTWDVNAIIDLNPGHTLNNVKIQISKIVPNKKDYRICIDGIKKWLEDSVTGHLSIAIGHSADNKCVKDEALIEINMKGAISNQQIRLNEKHQRIYDECSSAHLYEPYLDNLQIAHYHTIDCVSKQTEVRSYEYDIKTTRIPENLQLNIKKILQTITALYIPYYSQDQRKNPIEENNVKILADYSVQENELNLQILNSEESYNVSGIKLSDFPLLGLEPDNYHFSQKFLLLHRLGLINSCIIKQQKLLNGQNNVISKPVSESWVEYLRDSNESVVFNLALKIIPEQQNKLGIRVISQDQVLEIIPYGDQYQIILNGNLVSVDKNTYRHEAWFSVGVLNDQQQSLILHINNYGLYIDYNGDIVKLDVSKYGSSLVGQCFGI